MSRVRLGSKWSFSFSFLVRHFPFLSCCHGPRVVFLSNFHLGFLKWIYLIFHFSFTHIMAIWLSALPYITLHFFLFVWL